MAVKKGLGKGLDALISSNEEANPSNTLEIDVDLIEPNKNQPRVDFDQDELKELADSINAVGIIQPLILKKEGEFYTIIAGERRYRAARLAGLRYVPAIIRDAGEYETLAIALIENLQRVDLNPMEEAFSYNRLAEEFGFTQEEIAARLAKSRSSVANVLRYINLPEDAQEMLRSGKISPGHAKALLGLSDNDIISELAALVVEKQLSVRALEIIIKNKTEENKQKKTDNPDSVYKNLERELDSALGTKIRIKTGKDGDRGKIEIDFYTKDELDRLYILLRNVNSHKGAY